MERNFKKMIKNYFPDIPIVIPQSNPKLIKKQQFRLRTKRETPFKI